jgi:hypothetical protein
MPTTEENNNINNLDLSIHINTQNLPIGIYRKPTLTDTTTPFTSNHPLEHKLAAYHFYIECYLYQSLTKQSSRNGT